MLTAAIYPGSARAHPLALSPSHSLPLSPPRQSIRIFNLERRAASRAIEVGRRVRIDGATSSDQFGTKYNGRLGVIREAKKSTLVVALYRPGEGNDDDDVVQAKHHTIEAKPEHLLPFPSCAFYHHMRQALDSVHEDEINSKYLRTLIAPAVRRRLRDHDEYRPTQKGRKSKAGGGTSPHVSGRKSESLRASKGASKGGNMSPLFRDL